MGYLRLHILLFIFTILCFNYGFIVAEIQDRNVKQKSEKIDESLVKNFRSDYTKGFQEILTFFDSINITITGLKKKIDTMQEEITGLKSKTDSAVNYLANKIGNLGTNITGTKSKSDSTALNTNLQRDVTKNTKTIQGMKNILQLPAYNKFSLLWKEFDTVVSFYGANIQTGKSFNGSTLSAIKSRVSIAGLRGRYNVIIFVNYLDEEINDFKIYDPHSTKYNLAPMSIPPHTQEIFAFIELTCCSVQTSFSYTIPSTGIRIGAIARSGTYGAGLAFVPNDADMKHLWESKKGIEDSSVWECCAWVDRNISVGYENIYARMFADSEAENEATFRI